MLEEKYAYEGNLSVGDQNWLCFLKKLPESVWCSAGAALNFFFPVKINAVYILLTSYTSSKLRLHHNAAKLKAPITINVPFDAQLCWWQLSSCIAFFSCSADMLLDEKGTIAWSLQTLNQSPGIEPDMAGISGASNAMFDFFQSR